MRLASAQHISLGFPFCPLWGVRYPDFFGHSCLVNFTNGRANEEIEYTPELREEAVKLVLAQGLSLEEAALRLSIPKGTLANWVSAAKRGNAPKAALGSRTVPELEAEVAKLRKELAEARIKRDIVKAAAYFARESLPSTRS